MQQIKSTITILLERFNGQVLIPVVAAAESVGIPESTARNKLVEGTFPIATVLSGRRRFVHVQDLASYVESLRGNPTPRRGRPRKTASALR